MSPIQQIFLGLGGVAKKTYVDDVFSTYLYKGTGSARSINTGIDMTEGGLVWIKDRSTAYNHSIQDTVRGAGATKKLSSNLSNAENSGDTANHWAGYISSFNNNGFSIDKTGSGAIDWANYNKSGDDYTSWTFRKAKGFFDVVTYTGNYDDTGSASTQTISHSLGSIPGCIIIKQTSGSRNWTVYHRNSDATAPEDKYLILNNVNAAGNSTAMFNSLKPTSTSFQVGAANNTNEHNETYVAYLFAGGESTAATARSVDFDGNDRLVIPATSDLSLNTNNFTYEAWVYPTNYGEIVGAFNSNPNYKGWLFSLNFSGNTGKMAIWLSDGSSTATRHSNSVVPLGQWSHVAFTKSGTNYTFYLNGVNDGSFTSSITPLDSEQDIYIAADTNPSSGRYLTGKISNLRITRQVLYTTSFRPSTEPLTTTSQGATASNVKLLCCNNSSATGSTVTPSTISSSGDPTASTDSPFDDPAGFVFGENEDQDVIKCGGYVGNASTDGPEIYLGFEPQWIMIKGASAYYSEGWMMFDCMRGITNNITSIGSDRDNNLLADGSGSEPTNKWDWLDISATGFQLKSNFKHVNENNESYVYMAIRRPDGYVGKPPELGTGVFNMAYGTSNSDIPAFVSGFPVDFSLTRQPATSESWYTNARLIGTNQLKTNTNDAQGSDSDMTFDFNNGFFKNTSDMSAYLGWMWKRHAGFTVCTWKGDGVTGRQIAHDMNNTVEMLWVKTRDSSENWIVGHKGLNGGSSPWDYEIALNESNAEANNVNKWNDTAPTSTHFTLGNGDAVNKDGDDYIALLFASVDGISKVGYYTGTGLNQSITVGFQPRFVVIKSSSQAEDWLVCDTARGISKLLSLNNNNSESNAGFVTVSSTAFNLIGGAYSFNGNNEKYTYYCHA